VGSLAQKCFFRFLFSSHYSVVYSVYVIFNIFDLFHLTLSRSLDQNILSRCLLFANVFKIIFFVLLFGLGTSFASFLKPIFPVQHQICLSTQVSSVKYQVSSVKYHASNQDFVSLRSSHPFLEKSFHRISLLRVSDVHRRYDVIGRRQLQELKKVSSRVLLLT
jgi:hypothetical protein